MRRTLVVALLTIACRGAESPTAPDCRPVMGALGNAQISGTVLSGDGKPVTNAHIQFLSSAYGLLYGGRTDAKGFFYVGDMWTGTYTYAVTLPGELQPSKTDLVTLGCGSNEITIVLPART